MNKWCNLPYVDNMGVDCISPQQSHSPNNLIRGQGSSNQNNCKHSKHNEDDQKHA